MSLLLNLRSLIDNLWDILLLEKKIHRLIVVLGKSLVRRETPRTLRDVGQISLQ